MRVLDRAAFGLVALLIAASPASAADAAWHDLPRAGARGLTVHARPPRPRAATLAVAVAPGLVVTSPFTIVAGDPPSLVRVPHDIGPDGTYDEYADLVRSIDGTPCGQDCTRRSLPRWGYAPDDRTFPVP